MPWSPRASKNSPTCQGTAKPRSSQCSVSPVMLRAKTTTARETPTSHSPFLLIRAVGGAEEDPHHVDHDERKDEVGAVVVEVEDDRPAPARQHVASAQIGDGRIRSVHEEQDHPGQELEGQGDGENTAERVPEGVGLGRDQIVSDPAADEPVEAELVLYFRPPAARFGRLGHHSTVITPVGRRRGHLWISGSATSTWLDRHVTLLPVPTLSNGARDRGSCTW